MVVKHDLHSPLWGYFYVIMAAVFWGISGSSAKFLFNSGLEPFQLVQLRVTIAAAFIFIWLFFRNRSLLKIAKSDIVYFMILGTFGMAAAQFTYLFAISKIHVAAAIMLQYLAPIFIAMFSIFIAREKMKNSTLAAIFIAVTGCYLVVGAYNLSSLSMNLAGIVSGLGSAISFSWYSLHGEYGMRKYNPLTVLFFAMLFSAVVWNILHPPFEAFLHPYSGVEWWWIFYVGVFGTGIPYGLFLQGVNLIRSARASVTGTLEPLTAGVISYFFLNEVMEPLQLFGGFLVLSAIILLQVRQEVDERAPALIRTRNSQTAEFQKNAG